MLSRLHSCWPERQIQQMQHQVTLAQPLLGKSEQIGNKRGVSLRSSGCMTKQPCRVWSNAGTLVGLFTSGGKGAGSSCYVELASSLALHGHTAALQRNEDAAGMQVVIKQYLSQAPPD